MTPEDQPGTHGYVVSPNGKWALHNFSSATHPPSFDLLQMSSQKVQRTLVTNDDLVAKDFAIDPLAPEIFETSIGGGITLSTSIVKPPGFDPNKKYPVLVNVYGEPFMTMVTDTWNYTFAKTIAREGYIVMSFDNQGTPAPRGRAWRKCIYGLHRRALFAAADRSYRGLREKSSVCRHYAHGDLGAIVAEALLL